MDVSAHIQHQHQQPQHPPPPARENLHLRDLKNVEYVTNTPETYTRNALRSEERPNVFSADTSQCYPDLTVIDTKFSSASPRTNSITNSTMEKPLDSDDYVKYKYKKPSGYCTKQVTVHVIVMALAGVVYMGIGGVAGYYFHKACKCHSIG